MAKIKKKTKEEQVSQNSTSIHNVFYLSFIGELVEIVCSGPMAATDNALIPLVAAGYMLEIDDEYIYLSDDALTISRAVKKNNVITVEIVKEVTEEEQRLSAVSIPKNKDEGN